MNFNCELEFTGEGQPTATGDQFLNYAYLPQEIYIQDDGETIESCLDVLSQILTSINCMIFQEDGEFYIVHPNRLVESNSITFKRYTTAGGYLSEVVKTPIEISIGVDQAFFHCSENQQLSNERSVDTFVLRHDFEYKDDIFKNSDLEVVGSLISGWNIESTHVNTVDPVSIDAFNGFERALSNVPLTLREGEEFNVIFDLEFIEQPIRIRIEFYLDDGGSGYKTKGLNWYDPSKASSEIIEITEEGVLQLDFNLPPLPADGDLKVTIFTPEFGVGVTPPPGARVSVNKINLSANSDVVAGNQFLFKKSTPKKEKSKDPESIRFDTENTETLDNVFLKSDGTKIANVTSGSLVNVSSGYYVAHRRALMQQLKSFVFSGDIYGEVPFLSSMEYVGISDKMLALEHNWDTKNNITYIKSRKLDSSESFGGTITESIVFVNTIKPTIEG